MDEMVKVFSNDEFGKIRVVVIEENPWFVGKDIAEKLGYSNASKAIISHVDDDDKTFIMLNWADSQNGNVLKGQTKTAVINESGVYSLIMSSKLPTAKAFKHWVTSEVLPSIRKHGAYMTDSVLNRVINEPETIYELAKKLLEEKDKNTQLERKLITAQPKADYFDAFVKAEDLVCIRVAGKELGIPQNTLVKFTLEKGYLYRDKSGKLLPVAEYGKKGIFTVKDVHIPNGRQVQQTFVTNKGKEFIRKQYAKELKKKAMEAEKNKES